MTASVPSFDPTGEAWERAAAEREFWREHHQQYLEQYPEQFVAVHDGAVVADSDLEQILRILEKKRLEPGRVWVRFITADAGRVMP
jgi:hypothetical protein